MYRLVAVLAGATLIVSGCGSPDTELEGQATGSGPVSATAAAADSGDEQAGAVETAVAAVLSGSVDDRPYCDHPQMTRVLEAATGGIEDTLAGPQRSWQELISSPEYVAVGDGGLRTDETGRIALVGCTFALHPAPAVTVTWSTIRNIEAGDPATTPGGQNALVVAQGDQGPTVVAAAGSGSEIVAQSALPDVTVGQLLAVLDAAASIRD